MYIFFSRVFLGCLAVPSKQILGLILMTTAIIYGTEEAFKDGKDGKAFEDSGTIEDNGAMRWHDCLYFTIVTFSTVG